MRASLREPLGGKRPKVLDVVGDHSTLLGRGDLKDDSVATSDKVVSLGNGDNVVSSLTQQHSDLRRQLLVNEGLHALSARSPATAAVRPLSYSASFRSICSSISSRYSP